METPHEPSQYPPRNFSRREESGPEHREMIPRHFNMHPQREVGPRTKHQMGLDDMRRFREELNESDGQEQPQPQAHPREYFEPKEPGFAQEAPGRAKGGR